jgi:hypothetical protein
LIVSIKSQEKIPASLAFLLILGCFPLATMIASEIGNIFLEITGIDSELASGISDRFKPDRQQNF